MRHWCDIAAQLRARGEPFVMVTIAATRGSTPREAGARMFVTRDEVLGTIGGGQLEYQCAELACAWFATPGPACSFVRRFTLGANLGQCCGGVAEVLFEQIDAAACGWLDQAVALASEPAPFIVATLLVPGAARKYVVADPECRQLPPSLQPVVESFWQSPESVASRRVELDSTVRATVWLERIDPPPAPVVVFGAGHVGSALVNVLAPLGVPLRWVDSRVDIFPTGLPAHVETLHSTDPASLAPDIAPGSSVLIMTHSHPQDLAICAVLLRRHDLAFCGLIGSLSKRRQFERRLRSMGLDDNDLAALTCPIGIDGITGKQPAEIAIAVAAQLLQRRRVQSQQTAATNHAMRARR